MTILKNKQINLSPLTIQEAKNKFEFFKNPKLFIYTKRQAFQNIQDAENFINRHRQMPIFFGIYLNQKQKLIGNCQLSIDKISKKEKLPIQLMSLIEEKELPLKQLNVCLN